MHRAVRPGYSSDSPWSLFPLIDSGNTSKYKLPRLYFPAVFVSIILENSAINWDSIYQIINIKMHPRIPEYAKESRNKAVKVRLLPASLAEKPRTCKSNSSSHFNYLNKCSE